MTCDLTANRALGLLNTGATTEPSHREPATRTTGAARRTQAQRHTASLVLS